jgi:hypothetical protein
LFCFFVFLFSFKIFLIQLWAFGRVKNSLEGTVELGLNVIKAMVGDFEVQRERKLWFEKKNGEKCASVRLGLEIGRSDATIVRHLQGEKEKNIWSTLSFGLSVSDRGNCEIGEG